MTLDLIDIGSNLTHESFAADRALVIARATQAGIRRQIVTGADLASSHAAATLAAADPNRLWSTAGVHPHHAVSFAATSREAWLTLLGQPQVVAVGECGLDYFRNFSPPAVQREAFVAQLELAVAVAKPVFLHQRDAHADFLSILSEFRGRLCGAVAHCFTGDESQLDDYLELGLSVGVTGWVCDERRGAALRRAVPRIPGDRLMLETDAPYLLPRDLKPFPKNRRNEPCHLVHVAQRVAALRGESVESLAVGTTRNAERFFALANSRGAIDS